MGKRDREEDASGGVPVPSLPDDSVGNVSCAMVTAEGAPRRKRSKKKVMIMCSVVSWGVDA